MNETLDQDAINLAKAIRQVESGGNFQARGKSGEYGAYQFTTPTWQKTASQYGINVPVDKATPEQQNEVAYRQIKAWKDQGYNPGQIASMWNSGKPDAYLDASYTGTNKSGVHYDVPAYAKSVATAYHTIKNGGTVGIDPQNPSAANTTSLSSTPQTQPESGGFLKSLVSSITDPISQLGGSFMGGISNLTGGFLNKNLPVIQDNQVGGLTGNNVDTFGYRNGEQLSAGETAKQVAGNVLQNASLAVLPEFKALQSAGTIGKVAGGALGGGIIGGMQGAGSALNQGGDLSQTLGGTLEGVGGGALLGGGLGLAGGIASKFAPEAVKLAQQGAQDAKLIESRAQQLNDFDRYSAVKKITDNAEQNGVDLKRNPFVQNAISGAINEDGTVIARDAINEYRNWLSPQESVVRDALAREGATVDFRALQSEMERSVKSSQIQGADLKNALMEVKKEVSALKEEFPDGNIPLVKVHDLKIYKAKGNNYLNPTKNLEDKAMASGLKNVVEKHSRNVEVKQLNKELQNHYRALEYLEALDGKKVKGGRLGRGLAKISGNIIGSKLGPLGSIVSGEVADRAYGAMLQNKLGGARQVSAGMLKESPLMKKTVIKNRFAKQLQSSNDKTSSRKSNMAAKNSNTNSIPDTLAPKKGTSSGLLKKKAQDTGNKAALGAIGGIQTDDKGNVTYDVKKGAMGALAVGALGSKGGKKLTEGLMKKGEQVYKEAGALTTKILKKLEGKSTVSKQFISDLTNSGDLKQSERDLIRQALEGEGNTVNVPQFAEKVKAELLPLKVKSSVDPNAPIKDEFGNWKSRGFSPKYESINLPEELRGNVKNYKENIYESPVKTSAGNVHFGDKSDSYFGHTRIEDMADNKTRRVIEVQSDLYQKMTPQERMELDFRREGKIQGDLTPEQQKQVEERTGKLAQYNDPTAHFRMIREEIKKAAEDGKTKLQFPTGETAMKIEGLGQNEANWYYKSTGKGVYDEKLNPSDLKVGMQVNSRGEKDWIITDVLGNGKFKAIPKHVKDDFEEAKQYGRGDDRYEIAKEELSRAAETFDISGKVDQNNPIYKFYEKEVQNYLKKFGGKKVVDDKGVYWIEVPIDKSKGGAVEAFGAIPLATMPGLLGSKDEDTSESLKPNLGTYTARGVAFSDKDADEAEAVLYGEVGNDLNTREDEARAILNVAINRALAQGKPLSSVLHEDKQFQAYLGDQYNLFKEGKGNKIKAAAIHKVIEEAKAGKLKNNAGSSQSYAHRKDGKLHLYKDWNEQKKDMANIK